MSSLVDALHELRDTLVLVAAQEKMALPNHRFDGEDVTAADVAAILRIPLLEAAVRLHGAKALETFGYKDVYSGSGSATRTVGIGNTIYERMSTVTNRRSKKKKRKRRKKES